MKRDTTLNTAEIIKLINHPLFNRAELARRLFPNNKTPEQALQAKLLNIQNKRITGKDCENVIRILRNELVNKIQK